MISRLYQLFILCCTRASNLQYGKYWDTWLCTPCSHSYDAFGYDEDDYTLAMMVRYVNPYGDVDYVGVYDGQKGVRPAFFLNLQSAVYTSETGNELFPYTFDNTGNDLSALTFTDMKKGSYYEAAVK